MKLLSCFSQLKEINPGNQEDFYLLKDNIFSKYCVEVAYLVKDL